MGAPLSLVTFPDAAKNKGGGDYILSCEDFTYPDAFA